MRVKNKNSKSLYRTISFIILFLTLFSFVSPVFAAPDYYWSSSNSIKSKSDTYTQIKASVGLPKELSTTGSQYPDVLYYYFVSSDSEFVSCSGGGGQMHTYIIVPKDTPAKGRLYKFNCNVGGGKPWSDTNVNLEDPDGVRPAPLPFVKSGSIHGSVIKVGTWKNDIKVINKSSLKLLTEGGTQIRSRDVEEAKKDAEGNAPYNAITIDPNSHDYDGDSKGKIGPLPVGTYILRVSDSDPMSDCSTGQAGGAGLSGYCSIKWEGETRFKLLEGGKFVIISTKDPGQKSLVGKELPLSTAINVGVEEIIASPFDGMIKTVFEGMLNFISESIKAIGGWINMILVKGNDIDNSPGLKTIWQRVRDLSLTLLTLGLLIIAFANILSIDIERYGLARMIPKLVIGIVMTYFSFLIIRFLLEVTSALQVGLLAGESLDAGSLGQVHAFYNGAGIGTLLNSFGLALLLIIIGVITVLAMLWLCIVLVVRIFVIWFLVAVAPLAFLMQVMPFTESLWSQWWARFWKWAFMGPAVAFMLWLTNAFLAGFATSAGGASMEYADTWIFLIMAAVAIFMAASLPMQMGGDVYGAIKSRWGKFGTKNLKAFTDQRKAAGDQRRSLRVQQARMKMSQNAITRPLTGMTKNDASAAKTKLWEQYAADNLADLESPGDLGNAIKSGGIRGQAALWKAANSGLLDTGNADVMRLAAEGAASSPSLSSAIQKNQKEAWNGMYTQLSAAAAGGDTRAQQLLDDSQGAGKTLGLKGKADRSVAGTRAEDYKAEHFEYLAKHDPERLTTVLGDEKAVDQIMVNGTLKQRAALGQTLHHINNNAHDPRYAAALAAANSATGEHRANLSQAHAQASDWATRGGSSVW